MGDISGNLFNCPFCEQEHPLSAGFCPDTGRPLLPAHKVAGKTVESYFSVGQMLGEGETGVVYGCENVTTRILFAARFFKINLNDPASMEAFKRYRMDAREVELTAHRNITELTAVGVTPEGIPYEIMEFLRGADLGTLLEQIDRIPLRDAGSVAEQALQGLEAAHARGIIHGSLNPSSLFLAKQVKEPVMVKLLDFGLVHILPFIIRPPRPAHTREAAHRDDFRAPEQISGPGSGVDHRSDLFSMGMVIFKAITGKHPFPEGRQGSAEALDAREIMPDLPAAVADFLGFSLSADKGQRFQSASDMLKELRALDLNVSDQKAPEGRKEKAAGRREKGETTSPGIGIAPVREVVVHTHKDYSLSRREKIIRFESDETDRSGKAGKKKRRREER